MNRELLEKLTAAALTGIISNQETMREITNLIQKNPDKELAYQKAIGEMAVKYAFHTINSLEKACESEK